jgi:hypothetical protein
MRRNEEEERAMKTRTDADEMADLGDDLRITKLSDRNAVGGTWVSGTIRGHRFSALVFPEPALNREWELGGDSRISKLWLQRLADRAVVYEWDRGPGVPAADAVAAGIVDYLCAGLAEHAYGR